MVVLFLGYALIKSTRKTTKKQDRKLQHMLEATWNDSFLKRVDPNWHEGHFYPLVLFASDFVS